MLCWNTVRKVISNPSVQKLAPSTAPPELSTGLVTGRL